MLLSFQEIVSTAQQAGPKKTQQVLTALYRQKQLDNIFMDLLTDGINKAKQESNPDVIEMFEFRKRCYSMILVWTLEQSVTKKLLSR